MIAVVLGGAECIWSDLDAALGLLGERDYRIIATNNAGEAYDGIVDHWCTLHAEKMPAWEAQRVERVGEKTWRSWTRVYPYGNEHLQNLCDEAISHDKGSSGMLAVEVAVHLGCDRIILCGVPMDARPNAFRDEDEWAHFQGFQDRWLQRAEFLRKHRVRSMSGWTRGLLGAPDEAWLDHG